MIHLRKMSKMAAALTICSTLAVSTSALASSISSSSFTDISGHWAQNQLNQWIDTGLAKGYEDHTFKPNGNISRAEFITLVNRYFGFTEKGSVHFTDVKAEDWFADEVAKGVKSGYMSGYEDGTIRPNNPISRQEAAGIIARIAHLPSADISGVVSRFGDGQDFPNWSKGSIAAVVEKGYMSGYPDGTYQPTREITRAEAIVTLNRVGKVQGQSAAGTKNYSEAGAYGPSTGSETITGDVDVTVPGVILENMNIQGNLVLDTGIGEGDVHLNHVQVSGTTTVKGGGPNSVHLQDSVLSKLIVNKPQGDVRVEATGTTSVAEVSLQSGAKLEQNTSSGGFSNVSLDGVSSGALVTLVGNYDRVVSNSAGAMLQLAGGTISNLAISNQASNSSVVLADDSTIKSLVLDSATNVVGKGMIENATINVSGSIFQNQPGQLDKKDGVDVQIAPSSTTTTGGGGGGGAAATPASTNVIPVASNMSLSGANFIGSGNNYVANLSGSTKIMSMQANFNTATDVQILHIYNQDESVDLAQSNSIAPVYKDAGNQNIDLLAVLGLSAYNVNGDGISAKHFAQFLNAGATTGTMKIVIKLTNHSYPSQTSTYNLTVNIQ
jgi:hypothetical protein